MSAMAQRRQLISLPDVYVTAIKHRLRATRSYAARRHIATGDASTRHYAPHASRTPRYR